MKLAKLALECKRLVKCVVGRGYKLVGYGCGGYELAGNHYLVLVGCTYDEFA